MFLTENVLSLSAKGSTKGWWVVRRDMEDDGDGGRSRASACGSASASRTSLRRTASDQVEFL